MPLDFPKNPELNQTYATGGKAWVWNGFAWDTYNRGFTGIQGPQGFPGATGTISLAFDVSSPLSPSEGDMWMDSSTGVLFIYLNDGDSSQWVELGGGLGYAGPTGPTGPQGEQGIQGIQGPTGATGEQGIQGNTGATGSTGPVGDYVESVNGVTGAVVSIVDYKRGWFFL